MGFFEDVDVEGVEDSTKIKVKPKPEKVEKGDNSAVVSISPDELLDEAFEDMMPMDEDVSTIPEKKEIAEDVPVETPKNNRMPSTKQKEVANSDMETTISKDVVIEGSVKCSSAIRIAGTITGEVSSKGNIIVDESASIKGGAISEDALYVSGTVKGNVRASTVIVDTGRILNGNIDADSMLVKEKAIVVAPISAQTLEIVGAVKGDINVKDKVTLRPTAIVQGNITSASISIEDGASIDGTCTQTYAKVKPADFFSNIDIDE